MRCFSKLVATLYCMDLLSQTVYVVRGIKFQACKFLESGLPCKILVHRLAGNLQELHFCDKLLLRHIFGSFCVEFILTDLVGV